MSEIETNNLDKKRMREALESDFSNQDGLLRIKLTLSESTSSAYQLDPSYWLWRLSRYKHVSRIIAEKNNVLEIGSGDCFASPMVAKNVKKLTCIEFLKEHVDYAKRNITPLFKNIEVFNYSFPEDFEKIKNIPPKKQGFDVVFSLDVFEHIRPDFSENFTLMASKLLTKEGLYLVGIPSLDSQAYASEGSKIGHVNCMNKNQLSNHLKSYFHNVIIFGINDETLHTGFGPMCHYYLAVCSNKKN